MTPSVSASTMGQQDSFATGNGVLPAALDAGVDIAEQSYLTYFVPSRTRLRIDETLVTHEPGTSLKDSLGQRGSLFFGWPNPIPSFAPGSAGN